MPTLANSMPQLEQICRLSRWCWGLGTWTSYISVGFLLRLALLSYYGSMSTGNWTVSSDSPSFKSPIHAFRLLWSMNQTMVNGDKIMLLWTCSFSRSKICSHVQKYVWKFLPCSQLSQLVIHLLRVNKQKCLMHVKNSKINNYFFLKKNKKAAVAPSFKLSSQS